MSVRPCQTGEYTGGHVTLRPNGFRPGPVAATGPVGAQIVRRGRLPRLIPADRGGEACPALASGESLGLQG
jgi:hypothetical protein